MLAQRRTRAPRSAITRAAATSAGPCAKWFVKSRKPALPAAELVCFFQAEDGIRDIGVTGVQTCALPISIENGAVFDFLAHPSCLYVTDPEFRTIDLICDLVRKAGDRAAIADLGTIARTART